MDKISGLILASTIALIALIAIQVQWIQQSRHQIEEEFDQRVRMALCSAVSEYTQSKKTTKDLQSRTYEEDKIITTDIESVYDKEVLDTLLSKAFNFFQVNLDYEVVIVEKKRKEGCDATPYSCELHPFVQNKQYSLSLIFPGKDNYIFEKVGYMMVASILLMIFISGVFFFINFMLLKQKKMAQISLDFFNNMAHEFRTPLTNIALANRLRSKQFPGEKDKYSKIISSESKKLTSQVNRVLHLAKFEKGEYQLEKSELNISNLIQEVLDEMNLLFAETEAKVVFNEPQSEILLKGDKFHLGNAFRNLIDNALKYNDKAPEIEISIEEKKEYVHLHFKDNGIGIQKKDQSLIFEKYQRIGSGNRHDRKGFGIGLSYVRLIVEAHSGFIKIFSDLRKGSHFELAFPKALS